MDAVEFLREWDRMCDSMDDCCEGCDLSKWGIGCKEYAQKHPEDAVRTVKGWIEKHPKKTRVSEFLKMFPNAQLQPDGMLDFDLRPCDIDTEYADKICNQYPDCQDCCKEYWLAEAEE